MRMRIWTLSSLAAAVALALLAGRATAQTPTPAPAPAPAQPPAANAVPGQAGAAAGQVGKPAAVVNGVAISLAQVDLVLSQLGPRPVELPETKLRQMRLDVVGDLIDDTLLDQFIRQNCPPANAEDINKAMAEHEAQLKKEGKTFDQFCRETGQTATEVRESFSNMFRWRDYVKARLSDADVKRYYDENKDFFDGVTVRASHIVTRAAPDTPEAERNAARDKLLALRQEIVAGKLDFAEAAKKNSQCPTAPGGGDIGFFPRKGLVDEAFARAAFALQVGQVSDVVQTEFGLHLIKVTDRKAGTPSEFEKIKEEVREMAALDLRQGVLAQMRKASKIEISLP